MGSAFHDLLNDLDKEAVMSDVKSWVDAHLRVAQ
jgi:alpha-beta hydrolase superfamily lysophospholipase